MKLTKRSLKVSAVAALVPIVFAGELLLPEHATLHVGVGEALGCSGAGPTAPRPDGWTLLKPSLDASYAPDAVPVATDGFFAVTAEGNNLSAEAAESGMQIVVTDEAGDRVDGAIKLLESPRPNSYIFGWSADEPLAVGAKLKAKLSTTSPVDPSATASVGGEFAFGVVGEPTALPDASFKFSWVDYYLGRDGATLGCETLSTDSCRTTTVVDVPTGFDERDAADVTWQRPKVTGGVVWSARIEAVTTTSDASLGMTYDQDFLGVGETELSLGRVVFPTTATSYCLALVIKDLRTDAEARTEKCFAPEPTQVAASDSALGICRQPPSETLTEPWCRLRSPNAPRDPACDGSGGSGGSAGSVGTGGSRTGEVSEPSGSGAGPKPSGTGGSRSEKTDDAPAQPQTSKGCQLGGTAAAPFSGLAWLALIGCLLRRRR